MPEQITAVGLGSGEDFRAAYPLTQYMQIAANQRLPFADRQFDIATSNAVLEHVGSPEHQELFVHELIRVARKVFISVPNRYFPVEHHTAIPFLHYSDAAFHLACRALGKMEWTEAENLILMSREQPGEAGARRRRGRDGLHRPARSARAARTSTCSSINRPAHEALRGAASQGFADAFRQCLATACSCWSHRSR